MRTIKRSLAILLLFGATAFAQEDPAATPAPVATPPLLIKVNDLETLTISALRKEFPRLSGVFASAHSCRLPEYGPMVSVTIQLPAFYFTRPVLQELDRRQRANEEQARKVRNQLERASQLISLRSKEANLMERIEWEESSKKKSREVLVDLQSQLTDVRKSLNTLESDEPEGLLLVDDAPALINEVDLNKMLASNYQQLIQRVSNAMKSSLAENAPRIVDLESEERVALNTYIRDNILGSSGKSILFILHSSDIQDYKDGVIDMDELRERVHVSEQPRD